MPGVSKTEKGDENDRDFIINWISIVLNNDCLWKEEPKEFCEPTSAKAEFDSDVSSNWRLKGCLH